MGCTWTGVLSARSRMNSTTSRVWIGGFVLGMQATDVNPPATAARAPVLIVSLCSNPGSRKCTCMSIQPGEIILPDASTVSTFSAVRPGATSAITPSRIRMSASRVSPLAGSRRVPWRISRSDGMEREALRTGGRSRDGMPRAYRHAYRHARGFTDKGRRPAAKHQRSPPKTHGFNPARAAWESLYEAKAMGMG